jgi:hypothetical protein
MLPDKLSEEEKELIELFRAVDIKTRNRIIKILRSELKSTKKSDDDIFEELLKINLGVDQSE